MTQKKYKKIDVRYMQRESLLNVGEIGSLRWTSQQTGNMTGRIDYEVQHDSVCFKYNVRSNSNEALRPYEYFVPVTHTPCNYGGSRAWFECPHYLKRVAVLYIDERIACRTCHKFNYIKGTWQERDRMYKVREKLGWPLLKDVYVWQRIKPKGMH